MPMSFSFLNLNPNLNLNGTLRYLNLNVTLTGTGRNEPVSDCVLTCVMLGYDIGSWADEHRFVAGWIYVRGWIC